MPFKTMGEGRAHMSEVEFEVGKRAKSLGQPKVLLRATQVAFTCCPSFRWRNFFYLH